MTGPFDLALVQGGTYERVFAFQEAGTPMPLGGFTLLSQVRKKEDPTSTLLLDLEPYFTLAGDGLSVTLRIPATVTAALKWSDWKRGGFWDLFLVTSGDPTQAEPVLAGAATLDPSATQTLVP